MKRFFNKLYKTIQLSGLRKSYHRNDGAIKAAFSRHQITGGGTALDLASGPKPRNPFLAQEIFGVDIRANETNNVIFSDISQGNLPFPDNKFDFISAYDVLEHIPRMSLHHDETVFPLILLMNEIFRVLKPNGIFFCIQPCYPFKEAFQDPTHVNIMTEDTMHLYFCEPSWVRIYGHDESFVMLEEGWYGSKYFSFLKKCYDQPIRNLEFVQR